jgi:hypothetical protein
MSNFFVFLMTSLILSGVASAQESSMKISSDCDLADEGVQSTAVFLDFFASLKKAESSKNIDALAKLVIYPISTPDRKHTVKNEVQFKKNFSLFASSLQAVESQTADTLFCNSQGIMVGTHGEVWVAQVGNKLGIIAVNPKF